MRQPKTKRIRFFLFILGLFFFQEIEGHPMPNSVVNLYVTDQGIMGEAKMPLIDFETVFKKPKEKMDIQGSEIRRYFMDHIKIRSNSENWQTSIDSIGISTTKDLVVGKYEELWLTFSCKPLHETQARKFTFLYDVIIHQIINHKILVNVVQDWQGGILGGQRQVGEISLNIPQGRYYPLEINLEKGSWWKGFGSIIALGMQHIAEGTDHLLFLFVLLLPCMLLSQGNTWGSFGGVSYGIKNMLKIVTAFTLGHSITLFVGTFQWLKLPQQIVEIWIAISILLSAVHAYKPLFAHKEGWIALCFGFIHGLAFASILMEMRFSNHFLVWSILGFNVGIELMQLLIILLVFPFIFWLSKKAYYHRVRKVGALLSFLMAGYWLIERIFFF